jgi:hypothetical protein
VSGSQTLRAVVFVDPGPAAGAASGAWGLAVELDGQATASFVAPDGAAASGGAQANFEVAPDGPWFVRGEQLSLEVIPAEAAAKAEAEAAAEAAGDGASPRTEAALCRMSGTLAGQLLGEGVPAVRTVLRELDLSAGEALRLVAVVFPEGASYLLSARRPKRAKGHDRDVVDGHLLEPGRAASFEDPRLTSTYAEGGLLRAGLELWLAGDDGDEETQFPHRVAGEVHDPPLRAEGPKMTLQAWRLRCHGRGREGLAIYALLEGQ